MMIQQGMIMLWRSMMMIWTPVKTPISRLISHFPPQLIQRDDYPIVFSRYTTLRDSYPNKCDSYAMMW